MAYKIPILLICFNRPDHTRQTLQRILEVHPHELYIFQDGARDGNTNDAIKCQQVRDVINELVAEYKAKHNSSFLALHSYFSEANLGCGPGPYAAMSWFFSQVEYGIILEDDIMPHPLFWKYMEDLLPRYASNDGIGAVMGHNIYRKYSLCNSYYFTYDTEGTLGWGTWKRVWENVKFDVEIDDILFGKSLEKNFGFPKLSIKREIQYFHSVLDCDRHDRWDYQFEYTLKLLGYLNIKPNSCLTSHEGNDLDATHTGYVNPNYRMEVYEKCFNPIRHPWWVRIDIQERLRIWKRSIKEIFHV